MISALAFMDDANWFTNSKANAEHILKIADEFYTYTKAAINKKKTQIITTAPIQNDQVELMFGNERINIKVSRQPTRFLGVWFHKDIITQQKYIKDTAQKTVNNFLVLIRMKRLTDRQMIYIINMILTPTIFY